MTTKPNSQLPLVSVIIPNYNYAQYLPQSIESVLNQTYPNIELIVVDDGSTDNSSDVIRPYEKLLTLIEQDNAGVSAARNHGLALAKGDFICFLDSDDSWESEKIERQIPKFLDTTVGVVYSSINICDESLAFREIMPALHRGDCSGLYFKYPTSAIVLLGCSGAMIRRDVAIEVGNFDTSLNTSADWDYFRRIANVTRVDFVDIPLVNYRRHSGSMSSGSLKKYYLDNELAIIKQIKEVYLPGAPIESRSSAKATWIRFQLGAVKALLKGRTYSDALRHFLRLFAYPSARSVKESQKA